jgi:hypothetical protein
MIYHLTSSKDSYITNKVVNSVRRATTANVGYSSTIDLFKLHNESSMKGEDGDIQELSRGLLYFDLDSLETSLSTKVATTDSTLKIELVLKDIQGTQVAPSQFELELYPLKQAFNEGLGTDIIGFTELDATNWLSASLGVKWNNSDTSGAGGIWDAPGGWWSTAWTDVHSTGYVAKQTFTKGYEDLRMDITNYVKDYWNEATDSEAETVTNHGWILKFNSTKETDSKTYFVKRLASRHSKNKFIVPKIEVSWEEYILDDRLDFETGKVNNLYIKNFSNGVATAYTENLGSTALTCTLTTGSFSTNATTAVNQSVAGISQTGLYKVSVPSISATDSNLVDHLNVSGSITLQEKWTIDSRLVYSGSINLKKQMSVASTQPRNLRIAVKEVEKSYDRSEFPVIRLFIEDRNKTMKSVRQLIELKSMKLEKVYYQIKDANNGSVIIPFSDKLATPTEYTRLSADEDGMYFSFPASVFPHGKTYTIDIAYYDYGNRRIHESNIAFKVT